MISSFCCSSRDIPSVNSQARFDIICSFGSCGFEGFSLRSPKGIPSEDMTCGKRIVISMNGMKRNLVFWGGAVLRDISPERHRVRYDIPFCVAVVITSFSQRDSFGRYDRKEGTKVNRSEKINNFIRLFYKQSK